jgi:hypothetical protein
MNLVIVAGGLGSRLAPLTNQIPKFLVNIGKNTGYVEMIRYWKTQLNFTPYDSEVKAECEKSGFKIKEAEHTLTVIVHSKYKAMVEAYHKLYFPEVPLLVKTVDVANGSAHAILTSCEHLVGDEALFAWCDIIPTGDLGLDEIIPRFSGANVVFTNYQNSNRYELVRAGDGWADMKVSLSPTERGGCFGLYYISHFTTAVEYQDGQDFIEIIHRYGKIREQRIEQIIDFGDMPKLIRTRENADEARSFNTVEPVGDEYILKQAVNEQGRKIMAKEIAWYKRLDELLEPHHTRPAVPKTWIAGDGSGFFMTRVHGVPIWKAWPNLSPVDRRHVLSQVIKQRRMLFNLDVRVPDRLTVLDDVRQEAKLKLIARYNEIKDLIDSFGPIENVNGWELQQSPLKTIHELGDSLVDWYFVEPSEYGFVHGDLQLSNSMVDLRDLTVSIIDPRGYFGNTVGAGLEDYDAGKLLYALHGYGEFDQSKTFHISYLQDRRIEFEIPAVSWDGIEQLMADEFKPIHYGWLAVNFIGLAQYIKNDPVKAVCAHYHGLMLAEQYLGL